MTISSTQPKWALVGVRVCAVYLALVVVVFIAAFFIGVNNGTSGWLLLLSTLFTISLGLHTLKLWQIQPGSRRFVADVFVSQIIWGVLLLVGAPAWNLLTRVVICCALTVIGIIGWIFLTRSAVKALFQNRQH